MYLEWFQHFISLLPPSCIGQSIISHARNIYANLLHSCSWIGRKPPLRRLVVFQANSTVFPLKLSWLLIVAQQRISLSPSPHDAAGYEGQIWRASFGAVRGQNWGNQKQHRLTTQQFIDTNTAKQRRTRPEHNTLGGFLGTGGGNRTRTPSLAMDFESTSSTSSNTPAGETSAYQRTAQAIIQDEPEKGNKKKEFLWREIG